MEEKELTLFEEAKKSKVLLNGIITTVLFLLMIIIGQILGTIVLVMLGRFSINLDFNMGSLELILLFSLPLLLCFTWVKFIEKRKISSLGLNKKKFLIKFLKGFLIGLVMFSLVTFLMYITGVISLEQGMNIGLKFIPSILIILPAWILQSSTEEILSRGWLMNVVGAKHNPIVGFIVSSVIFGFLHIFNPGVNFISIVNVVLVGFMFGLYVIYTQDLWGACGIHAAWNFSQGNIYGFNVSGMTANSNSLIKFSSNGSSLLTGGQFGPEASIYSTIIISTGIIILIYKIIKQQSKYKLQLQN